MSKKTLQEMEARGRMLAERTIGTFYHGGWSFEDFFKVKQAEYETEKELADYFRADFVPIMQILAEELEATVQAAARNEITASSAIDRCACISRDMKSAGEVIDWATMFDETDEDARVVTLAILQSDMPASRKVRTIKRVARLANGG